jgi:hypothetical protein
MATDVGMDQSWTPLWSMIVTSTLWGESKEVKILFVTMMAMKDCYGKVTATTSGLSRAAVLTFDETVKALKVLESPDEKSDTRQEFEGRRIKRVDGGWVILNSDKYRGMISDIKRRNYQRNWMAEQREIKSAIEQDRELDPEKLSPAGRKRWEKVKKAEFNRRMKIVERNGSVAGGAEAVEKSLAEANAHIVRGNQMAEEFAGEQEGTAP